MEAGHKSSINSLISNGADPFVKDNQQRIPLVELVLCSQISPGCTLEIIHGIFEHPGHKKKREVLLDILQAASEKGKGYQKLVNYLVKELDVDVLPSSHEHDDEHSTIYNLLCCTTESNQAVIEPVIRRSTEYLKTSLKRVNSEDTKNSDKLECSEDEPILHVVAANGLTSFIDTFQFIDKCGTDLKGDTILHTAARNRQYATLENFISNYEGESRKLSEFLNEKDNEHETVLHIVCKNAERVETIQMLIQRGADLSMKDKDGNTPLHDLIEKAATDEEIDKYITVWKSVVDNVVVWWCSKLNMKQPYKSDDTYKIYQRDALYYLRSVVTNDKGLSVIQFAANKGLVKLVKEMIWVDEVFVVRNKKGGVSINVTNFMPHLGDNNKVKYRQENGEFELLKDISNTKPMEVPNDESCLLDAILQVHEGNKAHDIFQIQPMKQLVRDYWFVHQWWTFFMLVAHLIYMSLYSTYSLSVIANVTGTNGTDISALGNLQPNFSYMLWPLFLLIPYLIGIIHFIEKCTAQKGRDPERKRKAKGNRNVSP